jgi:hypothetical protein
VQIIDGIGDEENAPLRALLAILERVDASDAARTVRTASLGRNRPALWFRERHRKAKH